MRDDTSRREPRAVRRARVAALAVVLLGGAALASTGTAPLGTRPVGADLAAASAEGSVARGRPTAAIGAVTRGVLREVRRPSPDRVVVRDDLGPVATFTVGSRTVTLRGPRRTFTEPTGTASVTTRTWVRLLPRPFAGSVHHGWLAARLRDTSDDVLAVARQYLTGAPTRRDASGSRIAGDASYGPRLADGTRQEGSDFNDYLGVPWSYGTRVDRPEARQRGALDCSGYVRAVFGHRGGVPMALSPDGRALPRRAVQMNASAPGVVVIPDTGRRPTRLAALRPGDLVFFDASAGDGRRVDHVGILLGTDSTGALRFLSSRKGADGPTMGDVGGRSVLSGSGLYASAFRSARRL